MFKVTKGLIAVTEDDLNLQLQDTRTRKKKLERSAKTFKSLPGRLDRRKFSTVNRTIAPWNKLPAAVAEMPDSVDTFKSRLSALRPYSAVRARCVISLGFLHAMILELELESLHRCI